MSNSQGKEEDLGLFWYIILLVVGVVCWKLPIFVFNLGRIEVTQLKIMT